MYIITVRLLVLNFIALSVLWTLTMWYLINKYIALLYQKWVYLFLNNCVRSFHIKLNYLIDSRFGSRDEFLHFSEIHKCGQYVYVFDI